jgi:hypothetical protein
MAAWDNYRSFLATLNDHDRDVLKDRMNVNEADLFAARSEDARVRLVHAFISDAKALLKK